MKREKLQFVAALWAAGGMFFSLAALPSPEPKPEIKESDNYHRALLLVRTMEMLRNNYVDERKVSYDELFKHAIRGMVSALDPYSDYEPPTRFEDEQVKRTGVTVCIGAMVVKPDGKNVVVIRVLPGSPAEKAGVKPGDQITEIDGKSVTNLNLARVLRRLRGAAGSLVTLGVSRGDGKLTFKITRARVTAPAVPPDSVRLVAGKVGYLKLLSFTQGAPHEVAGAVRKLHALGAEAIILDLRYNPGGLVESAVKIASIFLEPGKIVFRARSRKKAGEQTVKTGPDPALDPKSPMIVLVNAFSASCSEILTGALQDHKRARVLGVRTFGKGTILSLVPLPEGGAVRYASAYYVTPGGRVIEKKGIAPDHEVRIPTAEILRLSTQTMRYPGQIKPEPKGTLRDRQLARAAEVLLKQLAPSRTAEK